MFEEEVRHAPKYVKDVVPVKGSPGQKKEEVRNVFREGNYGQDEQQSMVSSDVSKSGGVSTNIDAMVRRAYVPDDPDNIHITKVNQELGSLFSSEPGERVIPFPFAFQADGKEHGKDFDDMNDGFLRSLKNPIEVREGDDEDRLRWKRNILTARLALLDGIRDGVSVKDAIREEHAFRVRAYEARNAYIRDLQDYAAEGPNAGDFADTLKTVNRQLSEQGIKEIAVDDIGVDGVVAEKGWDTTK